MRPVTIDQLPEELSARVRAATGKAGYLLIHERSEESDALEAQYLVEAITGDRVTVMQLALRRDASVSETTDSFLSSEIVDTSVAEERAELAVETPQGRRAVPVTPEMAEAVGNATAR